MHFGYFGIYVQGDANPEILAPLPLKSIFTLVYQRLS